MTPFAPHGGGDIAELQARLGDSGLGRRHLEREHQCVPGHSGQRADFDVQNGDSLAVQPPRFVAGRVH